ncbi:orotate phosphoribosyltransferase [Nitrospirillum sp. BR 11163]|uniref:orotate phosphoribosyltransferase n=1 Tax=Nitrospirillum sp. BR 11163 TaxID=3104323 RepID=UPI002AFF9C94|nr:orotate phosphoribosyltransferase [Nitrospirillum sp. BR 11163]MEA1675637.1 orotate phosphoribosyltransferase [Nitrospirillum sp. BR 11163]
MIDAQTAASLTARILLDIKAIHFNATQPFILTSGKASPVYIDCRKVISFPRARSAIIDYAVQTVMRDAGFEAFDGIAGGETAGISYAAWMADRMGLPMQYVRKKPKGFGRNAQIEGQFAEGDRILLVEDLTTDGGSKVGFVNALRQAGAVCEHAFVVFHYGIFPKSVETMREIGVTLHALTTWWDVLKVARDHNYFDVATMMEVEKFLHAPAEWSAANGGKVGE